MTIVLADLGGTHLRLAKATDPSSVRKYKIEGYHAIEDVLREFAPDMTEFYLAAAIHPRDGMIEDRRFGEKSHWVIDLEKLRREFSLKKLIVLNDLEAAAYGLSALKETQVDLLLPAADTKPHFDHPPKLLVGVGTGIGHAFLFERPGHLPFVQRSHGGHMAAFGVTAEQQDVINTLRKKNAQNRDFIFEDIVSGYGVQSLLPLFGEKEAVRYFWEFFGLYCNVLVSVAGAYGGVYLTGGLMDEWVTGSKIDMVSFRAFFVQNMVPVVVESLSSTPVFYCKEPNLPILGLSRLSSE